MHFPKNDKSFIINAENIAIFERKGIISFPKGRVRAQLLVNEVNNNRQYEVREVYNRMYMCDIIIVRRLFPRDSHRREGEGAE